MDKLKLQCSVEDTDVLEIGESYNGLSFTIEDFTVVMEGENLIKIKNIVDRMVIRQRIKAENNG